jgi:hypothetical protein
MVEDSSALMQSKRPLPEGLKMIFKGEIMGFSEKAVNNAIFMPTLANGLQKINRPVGNGSDFTDNSDAPERHDHRGFVLGGDCGGWVLGIVDLEHFANRDKLARYGC